jgi:hypothetical protein
MPLQATSGAASYDAFGGGGAAVEPNYIESVFSTWLYTGTGASQTITNGIDLSTKGGLVWVKNRGPNSGQSNILVDTARGVNNNLRTDQTIAQYTQNSVDAFNTNGFNLTATNGDVNLNTWTYASWTFRKQPKFFDVVTYTGNEVIGRTIAHNLGSVPACIIVKCTSVDGRAWRVYHRSLGATQVIQLNSTDGASTTSFPWNNTEPTSTVFSLGDAATVNEIGATYVAYLFAHNAGGFGLTGTDNVISCGSFTGGTGGVTVTLGYEPQWVMVKNTDATGLGWYIWDNMRGFPVGTGGKTLNPNSSDAEATTSWISPTATGFVVNPSQIGAIPFIYIAIRRGPMKVPTTGTSVFSPNTWTGNDTARSITGTNFSPDLTLIRDRSAATGYSFVVNDRLRGTSNVLRTFNTDSESTGITQGVTSFNMNGISLGTDSSNYGYNRSPNPEIGEFFARAPSFFDEVCYTGTGSNPNVQTHNLGVAPELIIFKRRNSTADWLVATQFTASTFLFLYLNLDISNTASSYPSGVLNAQPTSTSFSIANTANVLNASGGTYVAYLFATCPGVSKVGSYTGTGTTQTINCGFTAGSRFIMIKRTDSTGGWYVWDSARGIVAGNDPYLFINDAAAEVTNTDYVDTAATGFEISSTAPAAINANGGTYIFLAIA